MIEKYGGPIPQSRHNECRAANVKMLADHMTGEWVCDGAMSGKGTVESSWKDEKHITTKVHFTGTMQVGPEAKPVEWTNDMNSVYKGADCGDVKPSQIPQ